MDEFVDAFDPLHRFVFMLHDRVVAAEALVEKQRAELEAHRERIETLEYEADKVLYTVPGDVCRVCLYFRTEDVTRIDPKAVAEKIFRVQKTSQPVRYTGWKDSLVRPGKYLEIAWILEPGGDIGCFRPMDQALLAYRMFSVRPSYVDVFVGFGTAGAPDYQVVGE